jgi:hypothetical protein
VVVNSAGTQELDYPTGLGIGDAHELFAFGNGLNGPNTGWLVTVTGYEIPSNLCTGDCL